MCIMFFVMIETPLPPPPCYYFRFVEGGAVRLKTNTCLHGAKSDAGRIASKLGRLTDDILLYDGINLVASRFRNKWENH